ncbi:threonine-phosphate decarboxylase CobD [Thalassovita taeanensis]|uniref:threonine-phosphate decarboxylase n=1 Tax=Thalassovita taeanensis TaxID=657014 RepID=A0A1H9B5B1_9RHOB|nr:threonine-phosphate decarboxylase CobD [Thalassovita taeanensis]SEP84124.1 L-threonine O-3-phosphate decarboxylase [Thalassovita taeanensis]
MPDTPRDHGGGVDAAAARFGGTRSDWIDLSTGINPVPYPLPALPADAWTALPDAAAQTALEQAARRFWSVPEGAAVLAAPGASSLIARIPALTMPGTVDIPTPTYNEHAAAFTAQGWALSGTAPQAAAPQARVLVHPNNPTGRFWTAQDLTAPLTVIDESFCDIAPERSLIAHATQPGRIVLKSFGKFWGLAGLRLGFAIGDPALIDRLAQMLGPWPVSGPALIIGTHALTDPDWARKTRIRLNEDAARLDALMVRAGARVSVSSGTPLFRLYEVSDPAHWQERLARHHVWSRIFPYSNTFLRLGLPAPQHWARLEAAL